MIEINKDDLRAELQRFHNALKDFKPYSDGFIKNTSTRLKGFNSDFISGLEDLLENMTDSKAPSLVKKAETLASKAGFLVETHAKVDEDIGNEIKKMK